MKPTMWTILLPWLLLPGSVAMANPERVVPKTTDPAAGETTQVEVTFVLDTTSSMGGLIEGAKQKIWSIANQIVRGQPEPRVRVGLVAYRDRGDEYITRVFDLNADLDQVYRDLAGMQAVGGGDAPEHVNRALAEAVDRISWSPDERVLKIIFLVGDAPPHNDYGDGYDYRRACEEAVSRDIVINTIQCGDMDDTVAPWREIARLGEGEYAAVEQSGGMRVVPTPMDGELAELSRELDGTVLFYGQREARVARGSVLKEMALLAPPMAAERAVFKSEAASDESDLVDAVGSGRVDLHAVGREELPEELRDLSPKEREAKLQQLTVRRTEIKERIHKLSAEREEYLRAHPEDADEGGDFSSKVLEMLRSQAAEKGIRY